jgi:hypothetical protein
MSAWFAQKSPSSERRASGSCHLLRWLSLFSLMLLWACASGPTLQSGAPLSGNEDCTNAVDDDGDGQIDCADADCETSCLGLAQRPAPSFDSCSETVGDREAYPLDMIWLLDSSRSMREEVQIVADNLERLGNAMRALDLNVNFVLLGGPDVCVPPPLGGADCQNSERYLHVPEALGNQETLRSPVDLFLRYHKFLRPSADRVLVAVSDDNPDPKLTVPGWPSGVTADAFDRRLRTLGDGVFDDYVFHSIVAFSPNGGTHPRGCRGAQAPGNTYLALTEQTEGLKFSVCDSQQSAWQQFFSEMAEDAAKDANVPCDYSRIVLNENGESTDPDRLEVHIQRDGRWFRLRQLGDGEACTAEGGFAVQGNSIQLCDVNCRSPEVTRALIYRGCYEDSLKDPDR